MPFELTKTQQQLGSKISPSLPKSPKAVPRANIGVVGTMRYVVQQNGIGGLFYGLPIQLIQTAGKVGIRFSAFEQYKIAICADPGRATRNEEFVAGCAAGATEAALWITPCERLKVLRQAQIGVNNPLHTSWTKSLALIVEEQGISGLYRGLAATTLRNGLSIGIRFALYSQIKEMLEPSPGEKRKRASKGGWESLVAGAAVGAFTTVLNNPIDVVKSRMQADSQGGGKSAPEFRSTWHCITAIKERDGLYGLLFRGLSARLVKISTGQAVIFFIYEHAKALTDQFLA